MPGTEDVRVHIRAEGKGRERSAGKESPGRRAACGSEGKGKSEDNAAEGREEETPPTRGLGRTGVWGCRLALGSTVADNRGPKG